MTARSVRKRGLVLAGGGFKGAYQVGMLKAFANKGIHFDVVCGVSVGALNGALVVQGQIDKLEELWLEIEKIGPEAIFQYWPKYKWLYKPSLCSSELLRELLNKYVDPERIRSSSTKFYFTATELQSGQLRHFDNTCEALHDALLASAAIPPFFEPISIGGKLYSDGGLVSNIPLEKAIQEGCDQIIVMYPGRLGIEPGNDMTSRLGRIARTAELILTTRDMLELEVAKHKYGELIFVPEIPPANPT